MIVTQVSKIAAKKQKMRNIIFDKGEISRQDLLAGSGLSSRALDRYIGDLRRNNLIHCETRPGQRGRPAVVYRSNSERIAFAGLSLFATRFCLTMIDINAYLVHAQVADIPPEATAEELAGIGQALLDQSIRAHPKMALAAIGFNYNTYQQPPQRLAAFRDLVRRILNRCDIQAELFESSSLQLLRLYTILGFSGSAGLLIHGDKIRLHVVEDGEIRSDLDSFLRTFRHSQIDRQSKILCPDCGKRGCLSSLLTYDAVLRRWRSAACDSQRNITATQQYNNLLLQGETSDPLAQCILKENGKLLARALVLLRRELHLDRVITFNSSKTEYTAMTQEFRLLTGEVEPIMNFSGLTVSDSIFAAAEMMRQKVLGYRNT